MKVLIITGSRADWNGLGMVGRALSHKHGVWVAAVVNHAPDWADAITEDMPWYDYGQCVVERAIMEYQPDVALVAGDRFEILQACITCCLRKVPIAHIAGGDVTVGSMDNRYRDAITALSTIHFPTHTAAADRLRDRIQFDDHLETTGSPAIDRIKQTKPEPIPVLKDASRLGESVLLQVHPNTVEADPLFECNAILEAVKPFPVIAIAANNDPGGALINARLTRFEALFGNLKPAQYYWLLANCGVLVGNSSAGAYEAPCFGIPVVNVGDRQSGRVFGTPTYHARPFELNIRHAIGMALQTKRHPWNCHYGDGESAPRIVGALENWHEISTGRTGVRHGQGSKAVQL